MLSAASLAVSRSCIVLAALLGRHVAVDTVPISTIQTIRSAVRDKFLGVGPKLSWTGAAGSGLGC